MLNPFGQTQIGSDQMGALGQALMQSGYIPNSGMGGVAMQILNAYLGAKMMDKANAPKIDKPQPQITLPGLNVSDVTQPLPVIPSIGQ